MVVTGLQRRIYYCGQGIGMVLGEARYIASCYSFQHAFYFGVLSLDLGRAVFFSKGRSPGQFAPKFVTLRKRVSESSCPNYSASLTFPRSSWKGAPLFSSWPLSQLCLARRQGQQERIESQGYRVTPDQ